MLSIKLAFRNLFRHKTRLVLNLFLLTGAFIAIVAFRGFTTHLLGAIGRIAVETQYGHLQIAKEALFKNSPVTSESERLLHEANTLIKQLQKIEGIEYASPRTVFYGLLNTDSKSVPARFVGFDPSLEFRMQARLRFSEGQAFRAAKEAIIGVGLAKNLNVIATPSSQRAATTAFTEVTAVSPTLLGGINAMDLITTGLFATGFESVDNSTVYLSLSQAQRIQDSDDVDRLIVSIKDAHQLTEVKAKIEDLLRGEPRYNGLVVKSWLELADLYNQVETFYSFQSIVIEVILLLLLFLSISNTINMTVFERMGEIGTLRALGDQERDIQKLFYLESLMLAALSIVIGIPTALLLEVILKFIKIPVTLPLASLPIPFQIAPDWRMFLEASLVCLVSALIASIWPAVKGSKTSIVTALRAKV